MTRTRKSRKKEEAIRWIQDLLAKAPMASTEIEAAYDRDCRTRFSWATLQDCKEAAGIASHQERAGWIWGRKEVIDQLKNRKPAKVARVKAVPAPASPAPAPIIDPLATAASIPPARVAAPANVDAAPPLVVLSPSDLADRGRILNKMWGWSGDKAINQYIELLKDNDEQGRSDIIELLRKMDPGPAREDLLRLAMLSRRGNAF